MTGDSVPIGTIVMWGGTNNVPGGWLLCDGTTYSKKLYRQLHHTIGDNFGPCDDVTMFRVPDLRGKFVRGVDASEGHYDPDIASRVNLYTGIVWSQGGSLVGSYQPDQFKAHSHGYTKFPNGSGNIASGEYWNAADSETAAAGGSETRPRNIYLHFIIKAQ